MVVFVLKGIYLQAGKINGIWALRCLWDPGQWTVSAACHPGIQINPQKLFVIVPCLAISKTTASFCTAQCRKEWRCCPKLANSFLRTIRQLSSNHTSPFHASQSKPSVRLVQASSRVLLSACSANSCTLELPWLDCLAWLCEFPCLAEPSPVMQVLTSYFLIVLYFRSMHPNVYDELACMQFYQHVHIHEN